MKLDGEDREYLDTKFDGIHLRITDIGTRVTRVEESCPNVEKHIEKSHNLAKVSGLFFGAVAAVVAVIGLVWAIIK